MFPVVLVVLVKLVGLGTAAQTADVSVDNLVHIIQCDLLEAQGSRIWLVHWLLLDAQHPSWALGEQRVLLGFSGGHKGSPGNQRWRRIPPRSTGGGVRRDGGSLRRQGRGLRRDGEGLKGHRGGRGRHRGDLRQDRGGLRGDGEGLKRNQGLVGD